MTDKIREYERRKAIIEQTAETHEEYVERIKALVKELRV